MNPNGTDDPAVAGAGSPPARKPAPGGPPTEAELHRLRSELEVHRLELEMQNQELQAAHARTAAALESYSELFDSAPVGYFALTPDGTIRLANLTGARLAGVRRHLLLGRRFQLLLAESGRAAFSDFLAGVFAAGKTQACEITLAGDGPEPAAFRLEATLSPGQAECRAVLIDDSKRRQAEAALRESEHRWKFAIESAGDGLWDWDVRTGAVFYSGRWKAMLGFEEHEISGRFDEWEKRIHPQDWAQVMADLRAHLDGATPLYFSEHRIRTKDGFWKWILDRGVVVSRDPEGKPLRMIGTHSDVTARRLVAEKLKSLPRRLLEVQEAERRHLARELHDQVGQALTAVQFNLQASQRLLTDADAAARLAESLRILERVQVQVQSLSLELRPSLLDDLGLESALRGYLQQQAERAGLHVKFQPTLRQPRLDPTVETACFRVVQEAVTNVVRHARARSLTVSLRDDADALHLVVTDDGAGFDPGTVRQSASPGVGLGFVGMEERVEQVGGWIRIDSKPGRGTTVHARFPLLPRVPNSPMI